LCAEAFEAKPELADGLTENNRYDAACAAVLGSRRQAADASTLDDAACVRLRKQGYDWLLADLQVCKKKLESNKPEEKNVVARFLKNAVGDSDLVGVREAAELAKLPVDEREKWKQFWVEVEALLKRAEAKP
jgi:hypothetical protein